MPEELGQETRHARGVCEFVQALLDGGYLATVGAEYPVLDTTPKATPVLNEGADVFLSAFAFSPSHGERPSALCSDATQSEAEVVADEAIIETLKRWRKSKATELGVPPYRVFSNKVLAQLASRAPETEVDLLRVPGIGPGKVEAFGFELLGVIQEMVG